MRLFVALGSILLLSGLAGSQEDLSAAYRYAQDLIGKYRSSGDGGGWNEPSWSPSFGDSITRDPPKTTAQKAIEQQIAVREKRVAKIVRGREAWRVALEKIQKNENWKDELKYWVEESQVAQIGAIKSCLSLLIGAAGPLNDAIETHGFNSVQYAKRLEAHGKTAKSLKALLDRVSNNSPEKQAIIRSLTREYDELVKLMKKEIGLKEFCKRLNTFATNLMNATNGVEVLNDLAVKRDLALVIKDLQDIVVDLMKEAGLVRLQKVGMGEVAKVGKLGSFLIDYGYNSIRFYEAWNNVNDVLSRIDNTSVLSQRLGREITLSTDKIKGIKKEIEQLKSAQNMDEEKKGQVLYELRAREFQEAHFMGEWFSNQSGVRAPGEPIDK